MSIDSQIDERTLHEIYDAPFVATVNAGVGAVMCSYNRLNGIYACENPTALADLKEGMGFTGFVMSDWGATHSTVQAANAGLDMEMPSGDYFGLALASAISDGNVAQDRLDDMVTRILTSLVRVGVLDDPPSGDPSSIVTSSEHDAPRSQLLESNRPCPLRSQRDVHHSGRQFFPRLALAVFRTSRWLWPTELNLPSLSAPSVRHAGRRQARVGRLRCRGPRTVRRRRQGPGPSSVS